MFLKKFIFGPENVCNTVRVSEKLLRTNFVSCHEFLRMYFVFLGYQRSQKLMEFWRKIPWNWLKIWNLQD